MEHVRADILEIIQHLTTGNNLPDWTLDVSNWQAIMDEIEDYLAKN